MICPKCKRIITERFSSCPMCGQPLKEYLYQSDVYLEYWNTVEKEYVRDRKHADDITKKDKYKKQKQMILLFCCIGIILFRVIFYFVAVRPEQRYSKAREYLSVGRYLEAKSMFEALRDYKDSANQVLICENKMIEQQYQDAVALYEQGNFEEALAAFEALKDYSESGLYLEDCNRYLMGQRLKPVYEWTFSKGLEEQNGTESTIYGGLSLLDIGNDTTAAFFNGEDAYMECGSKINMTEAFTFHAWIFCTDIYRNHSIIFAKGSEQEGVYAFSVNQGYVNCRMNCGDRNYIEMESRNPIENNRWYCISITRDQNIIRLYIDGSLEKETKTDAVKQSDDMVTMGAASHTTGAEEVSAFQGFVNSIAIYDEVLNERQIKMVSNLSFSEDLASNEVIDYIPEDAFAWEGHHYDCFQTCVSWEEASRYCEGIGGHLAVISSEEENAALYDYFMATGYESAYFGYEYQEEQGTWSWVNDEEADFTDWYTGKPEREGYARFHRGLEEEPQILEDGTEINGTWDSGSFGTGVIGDDTVFICEWD